MQIDSKHIADADQATRKLGRINSDMNVDTHLSDKEVSTDALVKNEVVKEELTDANTKAIERIKIRSHKICIREDLAKEKMVFSQESSQAIFELGNVELIELKTTYVKGQFFADAESTSDPDLDMMRRIKAAFEVLKAPCFRTSAINAREYNHGPNLCTTKQKTHHVVVRKTKDSIRRSGIDGKMTRPTGSVSLPIMGQMLG